MKSGLRCFLLAAYTPMPATSGGYKGGSGLKPPLSPEMTEYL